MEESWFETNRRMWDERVPIHATSGFYDVDDFKAGGSTLRDFELAELPDVEGRSLVHLQCHFGLDTLSWARRGAAVTGLDFSPPAIETARAIARDVGIDARFELGNVYEAPARLGRRYDIVYTGLGAVCWLPDLDRWARVLRELVEPGGTVYVAEFHPITDALADDELRLVRDYFGNAAPTLWDESGTYADPEARTANNTSYCWTHPVSEVVQALLDVGMTLELFREHDFTLFQRWPFLARTGRDCYRLPPNAPSVPMMYSLRLRAS